MRKRPLSLLLLLTLVVGVGTLILAAPTLWAQEPTQSGESEQIVTRGAAGVASEFTYQGLLEEDGSLVTGTRDMAFQLHANATCTDAVDTPVALPDVPVEDGLFSVEVPVDPTSINGQARWLEVEVEGSTVGCQELLPVPYALSLRPGALISGTVGIRVEASEAGSVGLVGVGHTVGISGTSTTLDGHGGYFANDTASSVGPDVVLGKSVTNDEGNLWSDPSEPSSDIYLRSNDEIWLDLDQNDDENAEFRVRNGVNTTVFRVDESGNTYAPGTKSAIVETESDGYREVYSVESPVVVFEDYGSARVEQGNATVEIDPLFAQTVNLEEEYQVFLTPVDGWAALYVTNKTATSFEVRDADGNASIDFDYRIVAKRKGYEDVRLEPVDASLVTSTQEADE